MVTLRALVERRRCFAGLLISALQDRPKEELLSPLFSLVDGLWKREPLAPKIAQIALGSFNKEGTA